MTQEYLSLLSEFINPVYLQPRLIRNLSQRIQQEGSLELHSFLNGTLAEKLKKALLAADVRDGVADPERKGRVPAHSVGVNDCWELKGPPSRHRYLTLQPESAVEYVFPRSEQTSPDKIIRSISEELFKSNAFRAWLMMIVTYLPVSYDVEARRFRPGLDYTLATSDAETRLDVVLGLTPPPSALDSAPANGKKGKGKSKLKNVSTEDQDFWPMEWGGSDVSPSSLFCFRRCRFCFSRICSRSPAVLALGSPSRLMIGACVERRSPFPLPWSLATLSF